MNTITHDIETTREALRALILSGSDPMVIGFGKGFIGYTTTGFTFDPAKADRYEAAPDVERTVTGLSLAYTKCGKPAPFRVVNLKVALSHRLLDLHAAMELF